MGLSNFPSASEGVLPIIVMNTVMSVAILKKLLISFLELLKVGNDASTTRVSTTEHGRAPRGVSVVKYNHFEFSLVDREREEEQEACRDDDLAVECCVCLCRFEEGEEVSELSCKHFFHKNCLDKWFDNYLHSTCPLCRSIQ